ncbi:copper homeostasis protein (lipoprotein) [Filimonas zeae]|nr:copper resistance protein NlpE N-terminal domain-containing protein [Filimonas zeae]MDR6342715.1 copper homeostasis protein (lipoprotein) [Filimonas zeae]
MRKPTMLFLAIASLFAATSCTNNTNKNAEKKDSVAKIVSPFTGKQLDGLFADTLPCADCAGIITVLDLNADSTFTLEQEYTGVKGEHIFYQLGKWSAVDSILTLNEITEGPRQYKIINGDQLSTLDNEGAIITGTKLNYVLHRQPGKFAPKKDIALRGMLTYTPDSAHIKVCGWAKEYAVTFTPGAAAALKTTFQGLKLKTGERVLAEMEGKFILQPGATKESFSVEKFVKLLPGEKCKY